MTPKIARTLCTPRVLHSPGSSSCSLRHTDRFRTPPPPPPPFFFFFFSLLFFFNLFLRWQFKPKGGITKFCLEVTARGGDWGFSSSPAVVPEVQSVTDTHSEHRFPAPSSKLCQIWLRHWRGNALYLCAAVSTDAVSALRKVWVLNMTVEAASVALKHPHKHELRHKASTSGNFEKEKKSSVSIQTIVVLFCWCKLSVGG